ncbi:MAG: hypothetical protein M3N47_09850 [Chloroflexota bacterium]|nr:hypothetical protein [Chloroflexota bacterium]
MARTEAPAWPAVRGRPCVGGEAHRAFGLTIAADFALPGMVPGDHGAVDAAISLGTPEDVEMAWAAREPEGAWRSVFGDGEIFSGERAADGSYRLAYGKEALFFVSADAGTILCGPEDPQDVAWQRVLLDAVLMIASVAAGFDLLHAGAVHTSAGVVAVAAQSGGGKSSLVAELVRRGYPLFCDDVLVLDRGPDGPCSHPGPPLMNVPVSPERFPVGEIGSVLGTFGDEAWVAVDHVASGVRPLAAVCLLERAPQVTTQVQRLAPSPLHLRAHVYPLRVPRERDRRRFELLADLVEAVPVLRLCAGPEVSPSGVADMVERVVETKLESAA